jgi:glutamine synthetase
MVESFVGSCAILTVKEQAEGGIGLTVAMQAFNMLDHLVPYTGMGPVGEVRILPDPDTFKILPWDPHSAAMVSDLMTLDGQPWAACPRSFLKRMITQAEGAGLLVQASLENEFILYREVDGKFVPADQALCFSTIGMHESAAVIDDMVSAFEALKIPVDSYYPEYGPGQHELTIQHAEALTAADRRFTRYGAQCGAEPRAVASLAPQAVPRIAGQRVPHPLACGTDRQRPAAVGATVTPTTSATWAITSITWHPGALCRAWWL